MEILFEHLCHLDGVEILEFPIIVGLKPLTYGAVVCPCCRATTALVRGVIPLLITFFGGHEPVPQLVVPTVYRTAITFWPSSNDFKNWIIFFVYFFLFSIFIPPLPTGTSIAPLLWMVGGAFLIPYS